MTAGDNRQEAYRGAIGTLKFCSYLGLRDRGAATVTSVYDIGDISGNEALEHARELGPPSESGHNGVPK